MHQEEQSMLLFLCSGFMEISEIYRKMTVQYDVVCMY